MCNHENLWEACHAKELPRDSLHVKDLRPLTVQNQTIEHVQILSEACHVCESTTSLELHKLNMSEWHSTRGRGPMAPKWQEAWVTWGSGPRGMKSESNLEGNGPRGTRNETNVGSTWSKWRKEKCPGWAHFSRTKSFHVQCVGRGAHQQEARGRFSCSSSARSTWHTSVGSQSRWPIGLSVCSVRWLVPLPRRICSVLMSCKQCLDGRGPP